MSAFPNKQAGILQGNEGRRNVQFTVRNCPSQEKQQRRSALQINTDLFRLFSFPRSCVCLHIVTAGANACLISLVFRYFTYSVTRVRGLCAVFNRKYLSPVAFPLSCPTPVRNQSTERYMMVFIVVKSWFSVKKDTRWKAESLHSPWNKSQNTDLTSTVTLKLVLS